MDALRQDVRFAIRSFVRRPAFALGLATGTGLSVAAASVMPGVKVADPAALSFVAIAVSLLSAVALAVPVRALLRGSPMRRLREDQVVCVELVMHST